MRYAGRITEWNDDKGYGFISPNGGGEKVFVHVSAIARGGGRPGLGYALTYALKSDARGRTQAADARPETGRRKAAPAIASSSARRATKEFGKGPTGVAAFVVMVGGTFWIGLPTFVPLGYALLGPATFLAYAFDKGAAQAGRQRTPESTLHLLSLLGGWPGALVAQHWLRHKSVKKPFLMAFWFTVAINLAVLGWLASDAGTQLFAR